MQNQIEKIIDDIGVVGGVNYVQRKHLAENLKNAGYVRVPCKVDDTVYKICPICNPDHKGSCKFCAWGGCDVACDVGVGVYSDGSYNKSPLQIVERKAYDKAITKIFDWWNIMYFANREQAAVALKEYDAIRSIEDRQARVAAFNKWYESRKIQNPLRAEAK